MPRKTPLSPKQTEKWQMQISIGQFPASLLVPRFSPLHLGTHVGLAYHWNQHPVHRFVQTAQLGYFFHRDLQHAVQAYTEIGYQARLKNGLNITPLALGGGYVMSIQDMATLNWNPTTEQYERDNFPLRHNWMISLGVSLSYETPWVLIKDRKMGFFVDYRMQVQGIVVRRTVPVIAYSPLKLGVFFPL